MKDLLVHLNDTDTLDDRLHLTSKLAGHFNAHVTGLYVKRHISLEIYGSYVDPNVFTKFEDQQGEKSEKAKALFEADIASGKLDGEYVEATGDSSQELIFRAGAHDLVIVAKYDIDRHFENMAHVPTNVALGAGRPVMIVPEFTEQSTIGKSILVAWNGTKEATRAMHDAMPFLKSADYVNLVTFTPEGQASDVVDITSHLQHHGVTFDLMHSHAKESEIVDRLAHFEEKFNSDMLVMGAYGHSRFREYVLGGVSQSVFRSTSIPVLVSH